jgi:hypothetical protein
VRVTDSTARMSQSRVVSLPKNPSVRGSKTKWMEYPCIVVSHAQPSAWVGWWMLGCVAGADLQICCRSSKFPWQPLRRG